MNASFKQRRRRTGAMAAIVGGMLLLCAIRLAMLVLIDGPRLAGMARSEHTSELDLAAVRGPIADRNGKPLALSAETESVYARPRRLLESRGPRDRAQLAGLLGISPAVLEQRLNRKAPFVWLARHLAPDVVHRLEDAGFDGVGAITEYKRFYPESGLAAAVVGMAGVDGQGLSGVELEYDRMVRGAPVEMRFYHDALGHPIFDSPVELRNPSPGARLELTIDSVIQAETEGALAAEVRISGAQHGTAVVLDPFTGEVLAIANVAAGRSHEGERLHNPGVQDAFEPGSTIKGILGAIALDDRVIDSARQVYCEQGVWRIGGRTIHDDSPHDWMNLGGIISVSSNIGAAKIALALGPDRFFSGLEAFGLGHRTMIDLPGEAAGLLRPRSTWRLIDLADHGFGQGLAVTPIQLARAYAAIANGGMLMRPYVLKAAYDASGKKIFEQTPQVWRRAVAPETAHQINLLLRGVVNSPGGTGRLARVADFMVAGKTGTAQMVNPLTGAYYQNRLVASFVGFVPAQDPRLVVLVVLYDVAHGHFGGLFAAPAFSAIASDGLQHLGITPERTGYDTANLIPFGSDSNLFGAGPDRPETSRGPFDEVEPDSSARAAGAPDLPIARSLANNSVVPNFTGLSLRSALALARARGLNLESAGAGYVVRQSPAAGSRAVSGAVRVRLSPSAHEDDPRIADDFFPARSRRTAIAAARLHQQWARQ